MPVWQVLFVWSFRIESRGRRLLRNMSEFIWINFPNSEQTPIILKYRLNLRGERQQSTYRFK